MDTVSTRPVPSCCGHCESRDIRMHCQSRACRWVKCKKCGAYTGYYRSRDPSMPSHLRWQRVSRGGDPARRADRKDC